MLTDHKTREDFEQFLTEYGEEVDKSFDNVEDPPMQMMKRIVPDVARTLWQLGCFQQFVFDELELPEEDMRSVQFASGQRGFMRDPEEMITIGIEVLNAYLDGVDPNPGRELADQINDEVFGTKEEE